METVKVPSNGAPRLETTIVSPAVKSGVSVKTTVATLLARALEIVKNDFLLIVNISLPACTEPIENVPDVAGLLYSTRKPLSISSPVAPAPVEAKVQLK